MKIYHGTRAAPYGTAIIVHDTTSGQEYPLPYVDKHEHERRRYGTVIPGPTRADQRTFEWGYEGVGPADTAASILADYLDAPQPVVIVQAFKRDIVARIGGVDRGVFDLDAASIRTWAAANAELCARAWGAHAPELTDETEEA